MAATGDMMREKMLEIAKRIGERAEAHEHVARSQINPFVVGTAAACAKTLRDIEDIVNEVLESDKKAYPDGE